MKSLNPFVNQVIFVNRNKNEKHEKRYSLNPFVNQVIFVSSMVRANTYRSPCLNPFVNQVIFVLCLSRPFGSLLTASQSLRKSGHFRLHP